MRWLALYLRGRQAAVAVAAALASGLLLAVLVWWRGADRTGASMVVAAMTLGVLAASGGLGAPDPGLERTAAFGWPARRAAHLLALALLAAGLVLAAQAASTTVLPVGVVLRDAAGLAGLAGLGVSLLGSTFGWSLPCAALLLVLLPPDTGSALNRVLTWPVQPASVPAATVTALAAAVLGLAAYAARGARR